MIALFEKRDEPRFALMDEKALKSVKICDPLQPDRYMEGEILNISDGGFCLEVAWPFNKLSILKVSIPLSNDHLSKVPTLGEVRWFNSYMNGCKGYTVGLRFIL